MAKIKLRMAKIIGYGVKKRCRKQNFIIITATGKDDNEALENFHKEALEESKKYRVWNLEERGYIFDIEKIDGFSTIPLMPEIHPKSHNTIEFQYVPALNYISTMRME